MTRTSQLFRTFTFSVVSVHGHPFPIDMLRYDNCVPASEPDANIIRSTFFDHGTERAGVGTIVEVAKFYPTGGNHAPTYGRWESFGWRVLTDTEIEDLRNQRVRAQIDGAIRHKAPRSTWSVLKTDPVIVIEDLDQGTSVTNDAERVCQFLVAKHGNKPIFYYDTMGNFDELVHDNGEFRDYKHGGAREVEIMGEKRR